MTTKGVDMSDIALLRKHLITAQMVQNALDAGLKAQDIIDGVRLSHQEYLDLVRCAVLAASYETYGTHE